MGQPKTKITKRRRDNRRSHHHIEQKNLVVCKKCKTLKLPHTICENCSNYK